MNQEASQKNAPEWLQKALLVSQQYCVQASFREGMSLSNRIPAHRLEVISSSALCRTGLLPISINTLQQAVYNGCQAIAARGVSNHERCRPV